MPTRRSTPPTPKTKKKKNAAAQALGRLGGIAGTPAQHQARARNAQHAGRPRRVCDHCGEPVRGGHADRALDASCGPHGWHWQKPSERPATKGGRTRP